MPSSSGSPTAASRTASAARHAASVSSGSGVPCVEDRVAAERVLASAPIPSASSTRTASAATSGPIPSPGRTATCVIALEPCDALVRGDLVLVLQRQADVVEAVEEPVAGRLVELERQHLAGGGRHGQQQYAEVEHAHNGHASLETIFRTGEQDFEEVARALERDGVKRPSGAAGPWTAAVLEQELAADQRFTGRRLCRKRHRCLISSA